VSEQVRAQTRIWLSAILAIVVLTAAVFWAGCRKQPDEQDQTQHHSRETTPGPRPRLIVPQLGLVESLKKDAFLQKVFNYEQNKEWKFEGELPCIIDFYADWCVPCKMVEPILQELAQEYQGKLNIYRVDTQAQQELAAAFGIQSIPSMLFVPLNDEPQMAIGALPKKTLKKIIKEVLKVE